MFVHRFSSKRLLVFLGVALVVACSGDDGAPAAMPVRGGGDSPSAPGTTPLPTGMGGAEMGTASGGGPQGSGGTGGVEESSPTGGTTGQGFDVVDVILDTDMSFDCDDAGALSVLHSLADAGEARILGVMTSDVDINSPATVDAINTELGRPDIPIGMRAGASEDFGSSRYTGYVPDEFAHDLESPPNALDVYRQILEAAEPQSVVIVTVGFLPNVGQLLQAEPELVASKVRLLVSMAGEFPSGREFNIHQSATSDAIFALHNWPSPVVYSGYEIGQPISTGSDDATPASVKRSYETCGLGNPRPSWDQTAVLFAVRGAQGRWELSDPGQIEIADNGANTWDSGAGNQRYLIKQASNEVIRSEIAGLM